MEKEDYNKISQYNITRYLQKCFDNGVKPDNLIMENTNFEEISKINVSYYLSEEKRHIQFNVEETLAQNCMSNLPLESYEQYITADWLTYTKNHDDILLGSLIYNRKDKLLLKLHDLGIEKSKVDSSFSFVYLNKFIEPILNVSNNFQRHTDSNIITQEFADNYYSLVKQSYSELDFLRESQFISKKPEAKKINYTNNPKWLSSALPPRFLHSRDEKNAINELLKSLAQHKELTAMFEDAFGQLLKKHKTPDILELLGLNKSYDCNNNNISNILSVSLANKNTETSKFIINSLGVSQQDTLNAYDENITQHINSFKYYPELSMDGFIKKYFNNSYLEVKSSFFPDLDSKFLPIFAISNQKQLKDKIIKNKDSSFITNMFSFDFSSLNSFIFMAKTIQSLDEHLHQEGKAIFWSKDRNAANKPVAFYFAEHLISSKSKLLNDVDMQSISTKEWKHLSDEIRNSSNILKSIDIKDKSKKESNINHLLLDSWLKKFQMDCELNPTKNIKVKTSKI